MINFGYIKLQNILLIFLLFLSTNYSNSQEKNYLDKVVYLANKFNLPLVATNNVCFLNQDDFNYHEIRVAIHDGFTIDHPKRPRYYSSEQYLRSEEEMCHIFSDIPESLSNSVEIAKRCNVILRLDEYSLPRFPTENKDNHRKEHKKLWE